jgi:hypothetical protein
VFQNVMKRPARLVLCSATACMVAATGLVGAASAGAAAPTITINDPGALTAGPVQLSGLVTTGDAQTTTVLYALDRSQSTDQPVGNDCDGNGVADPGDNLNGDTAVGETLDCEIAGVIALDNSLAGSPGSLQVSLERFSTTAEAINLGTSATPVLFTHPGDPAIATNSKALRRGNTTDNPTGTNFDPAVTTAINTLAGAPAGPRYILLLSDGKGPVSQSTIDAAHAAGVHVRTFAIGGEAGTSCNTGKSLARLAAATGETCSVVTSPAALGTTLTGSQPAGISSVQLAIAGKIFPATLDLSGGWKVPLSLGAGSYTATATATLSNGASVATTRALTVAPSATGPAPGTATGTTLKASKVLVRRPSSSLTALPSRVSGIVGGGGAGTRPVVTSGLQGAVVELQGRAGTTGAWTQLTSARVSNTGAYDLTWTPRARFHHLRVVLLPFKAFGGSTGAVPNGPIFACHIKKKGGARFTATCHTIAKKGTAVQLLKNGHAVSRTTVKKGHVLRVSGKGKLTRFVVSVNVSRKVHHKIRL